MSPSTPATARLDQLQQQLAPIVDPTRMDGQVVIITGGAQGIGRRAAELMASKGAKIVISDLNEEKTNLAVQELESAGYEALAISCDLLDPQSPQRVVDQALNRFGKINVLVNGAGFLADGPVHKLSEEKFDLVMKVHNYVPFRLIKALASHWMDERNVNMPKAIVNIASVSGLHGAQGQINYSTAKAGVLGLTRAMAREWARYNVRVNAAAYGWIDTRMTRPPDEKENFKVAGQSINVGIPRTFAKWRDTSDILVGRRPGTADEAANVILFLASSQSSYMTGTYVECTGGRYL